MKLRVSIDDENGPRQYESTDVQDLVTARKRLCWIHPDDEPEFWGTDYVGLRSEHDQVIPVCRPCAARVGEPSRVRDGSEVTVGWPS